MPNTAVTKFEFSETAIQKMESQAAALIGRMARNLAPKFLELAEEVMGMATEVNSYVDGYECVGFKGNNNPSNYGYSEVTFLLDVEDGEIVPFDRMSLNTQVREIFFRVEMNLRDSEKGVSLEELVGGPVSHDISTLGSLERFQAVSRFISENLDVIADRIESGVLDPEKLGLAAGGRKRVTITSPEELVPAVAQFYMEIMAGGHGAVNLGDFFDGGWCITGIISVLDIHFFGEMVH